ncbi:hypothetical protein [Natronorubrum sp. A-ect3]|uniref:hypothetical protein n=1 Tax=Natronorubrum sp. A-ect3 TaxID=3242698 RepID=UPI00359D6662
MDVRRHDPARLALIILFEESIEDVMDTRRKRSLFILTRFTLDFDQPLVEVDILPSEAVAFVVFRIGEQLSTTRSGSVEHDNNRPVTEGRLGVGSNRSLQGHVDALGHVLEHDDGVALIQGPIDNAIASYQLSPRYDRGRIFVGQDVVDELELDTGDDVRVYDLKADDGLLLVDAGDDPRIATDGGHGPNHPTESGDLELVLEYTTIDDRRRQRQLRLRLVLFNRYRRLITTQQVTQVRLTGDAL